MASIYPRPLKAPWTVYTSVWRWRGKNIRSGVDTGLHDLNKITNGWQPGNLVIIAARPSMGKALRMDAKVLTPSGWKLNKDLAIGDQVAP